MTNELPPTIAAPISIEPSSTTADPVSIEPPLIFAASMSTLSTLDTKLQLRKKVSRVIAT